MLRRSGRWQAAMKSFIASPAGIASRITSRKASGRQTEPNCATATPQRAEKEGAKCNTNAPA
ncbi:hypothetical protein BN126_234 [Cronobacter sakazakii 680]|nr:hypothetical protein BN126_234 [Cronobacter sakazakii 680]